MIKIKVDGSVVSVQETTALYCGSQDVYTCSFTFDTSWERFSKSAVFRVNGKTITVLLDENGECILPWELLVRSNIGQDIEVGMYGVSSDAEILTSVWDSIGLVREGSELGNDAREPSAGVYEQVMANVQRVDEKVDNYNTEVQTQVQRAESAAAVALGSAESAAESAKEAAASDASAKSSAESAHSALDAVQNALGNIPAGSTLVINDLTTGGTSAALSAEMGKVLDTKKANANLLHNGYFANPVNQRGQTEYAGVGYTIDRWLLNGGSMTIDGGVSWSEGYVLHQAFEYPLNDSRNRTFSYLDVNGNLASGELTAEYSLVGDFAVCHANTPYLYILARANSPKIVAVKLELGDTQTLAHWDGSKWVLNEIPDYNEELLKCCMSKADSGDTYANNAKTPAVIGSVSWSQTYLSNVDILTWAAEQTNPTTIAAANTVTNMPYDGGYWTVELKIAAGGTWRTLIAWQAVAESHIKYERLCINGTWGKWDRILHTGNKPSGTYVGTGDATTQVIDTKGIGKAAFIYAGGMCAIAAPNGCIGWYPNGGTVATVPSTEASYANGKLTISTTSNFVNYSGLTYTYQVF